MINHAQKLKRCEHIHADGCDADRPFRIGGEIEEREDEKQDASQHPGRVADDGEERGAAADGGTGGVECDQRRVTEQDDRENGHHKRGRAKKFSQRSGGDEEEESAGGREDGVRVQHAAQGKLRVVRVHIANPMEGRRATSGRRCGVLQPEGWRKPPGRLN